MTDQSAPTPADIHEALFMLQAEPIVLTKDRAGQVGNQKTKYADIVQSNAVILPRLNRLGVLWLTSPTLRMIAGANGQEDPRFVLEWELRHIMSGTKVSGVYPLPAGANPMQNGSAISYARRYALLAATNAVAEDEDDDGQGYRGRSGYAQRENIAPKPAREARETAQRAQVTPRGGERARPAQQPELPPARNGAAQQAQPTEPVEPHRGRGGLITGPMATKLAITMKQAIGDNPADRKQYIVDMIGREVATSKDLTFDEGRGLIDAFEKANQDPDTAAATVIDIYRRTTGDTMPNGRPIPGDRPYEGVPDDHPERWGGDWPKDTDDLKSSGRQPGQRSRNAAEAIGNGGDEGTEDAPWEGTLPV